MVRFCDARNDFRDVVMTWGQVQYLLTPTAFILAVATLIAVRRRGAVYTTTAVILALLSAGCCALMLYRDYAGALGT